MTADVTPARGSRTSQVEGARDRPAVRRLLACLIVASWIGWAVPAWQSSLHEVTSQELVADIEAERVVAFLAVDNVQRPNDVWRVGLDTSWVFGFTPSYDIPAQDAGGRPDDGPFSQLLYTLDGGRTRWAPDLLINGTDPFGALQASGARRFTDDAAPSNRDWAAYPALLMAALFVVSLVGRSPRWGTKPFWVLVATLTAGVGMIAYAVRELAIDPPPSAEPPRLRWIHGLGIAVIGSLLLTSLLRLVL